MLNIPLRGNKKLQSLPLFLIIGSIKIVILIVIDFKVSGGIYTLSLLRILFHGGGGGRKPWRRRQLKKITISLKGIIEI